MYSPNTDQFIKALRTIFTQAEELGLVAIEIKSGNLHRKVGGYPGNDHRMPTCCKAMRSEMNDTDSVVSEPPSGQGASFVVRYEIPRK